MALSNWIELAALLLVIVTGLTLWLILRRRLKRHDGFEGFFDEKGRLPARRKMDVEEEIEHLENLLGKK